MALYISLFLLVFTFGIVFVQCFDFPNPLASIAVKRLSVETMNLGVENHVEKVVDIYPLNASIREFANSICENYAHELDDKRCISTAHHTIRSVRTNLVEYARDTMRITAPHSYREEPAEGLTVGYSYIYDRTITADKTVCIFGRFSLQLYIYMRLYSGAKNVHYFNRMGKPIKYRLDDPYLEEIQEVQVNSKHDYEITSLLSKDSEINSLSVHLDNYHNLRSIIESRNTQGLLSQCDIVHIRENSISTISFINTLIGRAIAQSVVRSEVGTDSTAVQHLKETFVVWERVITTDTAAYDTFQIEHEDFQHHSANDGVPSPYYYSVHWDANINTQSVGTYNLRVDSQGFYSRAFHPDDVKMERKFVEIVMGYSQYYRGNYQEISEAFGNSNTNDNTIDNYPELISSLNRHERFHNSIDVVELPGALRILKDSIISQYYRAWSEMEIDIEKYRDVGFDHYSNQPIMISYTCRVFGETSRGLQQALFRLGYKYVFIVPDLTLEYYFALKSYMRHTLALEYVKQDHLSVADIRKIDILQIVIAPLEVQVLLPNYIAIQLEQVWSPFFTHFYDRYSRILRNALGVWSYSEKLSRDLFNGGILPLQAFSVPVLSDTARNKQLVHSYHDLIQRFKLSNPKPEFSFLPPVDEDYYMFDALIFGGGSMRRSEIIMGLHQKLIEMNEYKSLKFKDENGVQFNIGKGRIAILSQTPLRIGYAIGSWDTLIFDDDRDFYVQRSKTILNIHSEADSSLELHRVNYLLSLGR